MLKFIGIYNKENKKMAHKTTRIRSKLIVICVTKWTTK
jgi:hypothetical protein